jgi:hypothetical protein
MRLINAQTLELEEFFGAAIPPYAILSHTWETEEVSFQDWPNLEAVKGKKGFRKIELAREQTIRDGLDYLWVDTNCINKDSSAELSEAINSMFAWYRGAAICYAYLSDVTTHADHEVLGPRLSGSRWFTRGWTLQELLAPDEVIFYSTDWDVLGTRKSLVHHISDITGIKQSYLMHDFRSVPSVAHRMSWLSRRSTTRVEDMAYCMLGIFDINMPLLYGEGDKAFIRLQEEILKNSTDQTIFCWIWDSDTPDDWISMLAPSPRNFADSARYSPGGLVSEGDRLSSVFSITNAGLSITLPLLESWCSPENLVVVLNVDVYVGSLDIPLGTAGIPLVRPTGYKQFHRTSTPPRPATLPSNEEALRYEILVASQPERFIGRIPDYLRVYDKYDLDWDYHFSHGVFIYLGSGLEAVHDTDTRHKMTSLPYRDIDGSIGVAIVDKADELHLGERPPHKHQTVRGTIFRICPMHSEEEPEEILIFFGVIFSGTRTRWVCEVLDDLLQAKFKPDYSGRLYEKENQEVLNQFLEEVASRGDDWGASIYGHAHSRLLSFGTVNVALGPEVFEASPNSLARIAIVNIVGTDKERHPKRGYGHRIRGMFKSPFRSLGH